uniref:Uncharacterized protein n=3 Tax=Psilocybe cubensis TaxID=181762 RepID=A0A8H7Y3R3_PSICU
MPRHDISLSGELDPPLYLYGLHVQPTDASTQCDVFRRAGSTTLLVQLRSDAMYCRPASWALLFACFDSMCNQRMLQREASSSGKQDLTHYVSSYAPTPCIAFRRAGPSPLLVSTSCATNVCPNATYRLPASWTLPFARLDFMCNQRMPQRNVSPSGELDPPLCSSRLHVQPTYAPTQRIAFRRAGPSPLLVSTTYAPMQHIVFRRGPQAAQDLNSYAIVSPLYQLNFKDWWFHHINNCDLYPPADGDFLELPAGGSFTVEIASNRAKTTLAYNGRDTSEWPDGATYPEDYSDIKAVTPQNLAVFTVRYNTPWKRVISYDVPANLPACPEGGCICAWGWVPNGCGQPNMYHQPFKCKVTGAKSTTPIAPPQPPVWCEGNPGACVKGSKQMIYWNQNEGNNIAVSGYDLSGSFKSPAYNAKLGFADGAQNDIFAGAPSAPAGNSGSNNSGSNNNNSGSNKSNSNNGSGSNNANSGGNTGASPAPANFAAGASSSASASASSASAASVSTSNDNGNPAPSCQKRSSRRRRRALLPSPEEGVLVKKSPEPEPQVKVAATTAHRRLHAKRQWFSL